MGRQIRALHFLQVKFGEFVYDQRLHTDETAAAPKTLDDYQEACRMCEKTAIVTKAQVRRFRPLLFFDKRGSKGSRGRALSEDFGELGLNKGDRIEPTATFPNIHDLSVEGAPREVVWWDRPAESYTRRRNPVFCKESGVSIDTIAIDWLHNFSLGIFRHALSAFMCEMIDSNVYDVQGNMDARKELIVSNCRDELFRWYTEQEQAGTLRARVQALAVGMPHSRERPELMLHGAETNCFLRFVRTVVLPKHGHKLDRRELWGELIGSCSAIIDSIWHHNGMMKMRAPACQAMCDAVRANIRAMGDLHLPCRQKHHLAMEMASRQIHTTVA